MQEIYRVATAVMDDYKMYKVMRIKNPKLPIQNENIISITPFIKDKSVADEIVETLNAATNRKEKKNTIFKLTVTYSMNLPGSIADSPEEIIQMFKNKEFILTDEQIDDVSAILIQKGADDEDI